MATKLKSAFTIPKRQLLLVAKATLFGVSLWLLSRNGFHFWELLAFWLIAFILYLKPIFQTLGLLTSFLMLLILSPMAVSSLQTSGRYPFLFAVIFSLLFYILLGIKQNIFVERGRWHYLLYLALSYALFLLFFAAGQDQGFFLNSLLVALGVYLLLRELYLFEGIGKNQHTRLVLFSIALITAELLWIVSLLPLGFFNAAALTLIDLFLFVEMSLQKFKGTLTPTVLRTHLLVWAALAVLLFGSTVWHLP